MKHITTTLLLIILLSSQSLFTMEHEYNQLSNTTSSINDYGSLTEYVTIDLEEQKEALINPTGQFAQSNLDDYHSMFTTSLLALSHKLHYMSPEDKCRTIQQLPINLLMSKKISLLLQTLMVLPPEIIKNIYHYVLDDETDAAEVFCELPFAQALEICQEIKTTMVNDKYTIGSLFVKYYGSRDTLAKTHNKRWYSYAPVVSSKDKEEIDLLDEDIRIAFLQDQEMLVDDEDVEDTICGKLERCWQYGLPETSCRIVTGTVGGFLVSGFMLILFAAIGQISNPWACGLSLPFCFAVGFIAGGIGDDKRSRMRQKNIMVIELHKEIEEAV